MLLLGSGSELVNSLTHDVEVPVMATAAPGRSSLSTRLGVLTLLLLCTVQFLDILDASIVNVALPSVQRDLHFS
jgi:hypothetical protein